MHKKSPSGFPEGLFNSEKCRLKFKTYLPREYVYVRIVVAAQSASDRGFVSIHIAVQHKYVCVRNVEGKRPVFIPSSARSPEPVRTWNARSAVFGGSNRTFVVASAYAQSQSFYFFGIIMESYRNAGSVFPVLGNSRRSFTFNSSNTDHLV